MSAYVTYLIRGETRAAIEYPSIDAAADHMVAIANGEAVEPCAWDAVIVYGDETPPPADLKITDRWPIERPALRLV